MAISYVLAVLAAVANATSNVLLRRAAREEPSSLQFNLRLLRELAGRKVWLAGIGVTIVSYLIQAAALGTGRLAVVQPLIILELPMTLIGSTWTLGARLGRLEWISTAVMTAGLAGLILFLSPAAGHPSSVPGWEWAVGSGGTAAAILALALAGRRMESPGGRAALLGGSAGLGFGLAAAFTKGMTGQFQSGGIVGAISAWQLYASVVAGLTAMWLLQNAYNAGRLEAAQPGITLLDPLAAILWGMFIFREQAQGGVSLILAAVSGIVMAGGAVALSQSAQLQGESGEIEEEAPQRQKQ